MHQAATMPDGWRTHRSSELGEDDRAKSGLIPRDAIFGLGIISGIGHDGGNRHSRGGPLWEIGEFIDVGTRPLSGGHAKHKMICLVGDECQLGKVGINHRIPR
jgi:hypothetical protein